MYSAHILALNHIALCTELWRIARLKIFGWFLLKERPRFLPELPQPGPILLMFWSICKLWSLIYSGIVCCNPDLVVVMWESECTSVPSVPISDICVLLTTTTSCLAVTSSHADDSFQWRFREHATGARRWQTAVRLRSSARASFVDLRSTRRRFAGVQKCQPRQKWLCSWLNCFCETATNFHKALDRCCCRQIVGNYPRIGQLASKRFPPRRIICQKMFIAIVLIYYHFYIY